MADFGEWIEHLRWIAHMSETAWIFSTVSVIHYFSFMVLTGTAVIVDLRVLGLAATKKPLAQLADQIYPWLWVAFWLAIISGVLLAIGYILLIIPGIFLTISWVVAVPVVMFEGSSAFASLRRSYDLVQGRWWATFGALVLAIIALIGIAFVLGLLLKGVGSSNHISLILVIGGIGRIIAALVTYPIVAAVTAVIYVDLRVRKEHVDPRELTGAGETAQTAGLPLG